MEYKGFSGLNGSYKISEAVVNRILSREFHTDAAEYDSISNYEILALIHFSQICDIAGNIEEYKVPDLAEIIGCSRRASYNVVKNLEQKGFLTQSESSWAGYRNIKILDNDFSSVDYKNVRYINSNFTYFNHNHTDYEVFKGLSLYAKKTLLIILLKYQHTYGYRVEIDTLQKYLGVSKKSKVMSYIDELRGMFDARVLTVSPNTKLRLKNHNLYVGSKLPCFVAETSITEDKDCYIKYRIETLFRRENIAYCSYASKTMSGGSVKRTVLQQIYSLYVHYNSKGVSASAITDAVISTVTAFGKYDDYALYHINQVLKPQIQNVS